MSKKNSKRLLRKESISQLKKVHLNAVVGKNGIGKSTLLRTLSKVQKPLAGAYFYQQKKQQSISTSRIGYNH